jgi:hypothetical protein
MCMMFKKLSAWTIVMVGMGQLAMLYSIHNLLPVLAASDFKFWSHTHKQTHVDRFLRTVFIRMFLSISSIPYLSGQLAGHKNIGNY